jgi:hypothetical protein
MTRLRWPCHESAVTAETQIRSQVSLRGIFGGQSGTGTGFFPKYLCFPLSVSFHQCSILIHLSITNALMIFKIDNALQ